jgi:hypothetical protein
MADIVQLEEKGNLLYPKTHSSAVDGLSDDLKAAKNDVKNDLKKELQPMAITEALWTGAWYGGKDMTITPSKSLSECASGWILQWEVYSESGAPSGTAFQFTHIPKQYVLYHSGRGVVMPVCAYNGSNPQVKYVYIEDSKISGNANNAPDGVTTGKGNKMYVLTKIYEY